MSLILSQVLTELKLTYPATSTLPEPKSPLVLGRLTQYQLRDEQRVPIKGEYGVIQYSTLIANTQVIHGLSVNCSSWLTGGNQQSKKVFRVSLGQELTEEQLKTVLKNPENLYCYIDISDPENIIPMSVQHYRNMLNTGEVADSPNVTQTVDGTPIPTPTTNQEQPFGG